MVWNTLHQATDGRIALRRKIHTSIPILDSFMHFPSSKITLIRGPNDFLMDFTSLLCVNGVKLDANVVYVDGGNSINPYAISGFSRRFGMDARFALGKILVSRAFTAYQFEMIITQKLKGVVKEGALVIVSCITDPFLDRGVRRPEGRALIDRCLNALKTMTVGYGLITVVTDRKKSKIFDEILHEKADEVLEINKMRNLIRIHKQSTDDSIDYRPVPKLQTTLEEFNG